MLPPVLDASPVWSVDPLVAVPEVWSQPRKVSDAGPPRLLSGTKRNWVVAANSRAALSDAAVPSPYQLLPSVVYCQAPLPTIPVIAMPETAPLSGSA